MNIADEFLRGFDAVQNHKDRVRRRGIEDAHIDMQRNQFAQNSEIQKNKLKIQEMQIEDTHRGQLKARAIEELKMTEMTGKLPSPESFKEFQDAGMAHFSPYNYVDPQRVDNILQLKSVLDPIRKGKPEEVNSPQNLAILNNVLADELNVNLGEEKPELGGKIAKKEISSFDLLPGAGGKVAIKLRVTLDNGMSYEEPMTVGRNANPDAPVRVLDARTLMDDMMARYQLGKFYQTDKGKEIIQGLTSALGVTQKGARQGFTLSEGQRRFDASGNEIASVDKTVDTQDQESKKRQGVFDNASKLRSEIEKVNRTFRSVEDAFGRIQAASEGDPTGASDMALIFNYMKMLDPGSTVREGEFASAANTGGLAASTINLYNKTVNGEMVTPKQRKNFLDQARRQFESAKSNNETRMNEFADLGERFGIEREDIMLRRSEPEIPLKNEKGWTLMTDANGNKAYVGPNNEVEEIQ